MPEGDTIAWAANRIRPVLEGRVPEEISSPRNPRWPERLAGQAVTRVDTRGKHLFIHFEGGLVLHSHLGMVGSSVVARQPRGGRRAWIVLRAGDRWIAQLDGPTLELVTEGRVRFDRRLAGLGPDVLADEFDAGRFLARLRDDDPTRTFGDALLDQRNVAGAGLGPLAILARPRPGRPRVIRLEHLEGRGACDGCSAPTDDALGGGRAPRDPGPRAQPRRPPLPALRNSDRR